MAKKMPARDDELSRAPTEGGELSPIEQSALDVLERVEKGYRDQYQRSNTCQDNWDMYNCILGDKQFYNGESKIYLPFVHDAVEAIVTRQTNQLFPNSNRYIEVVSSEQDLPQHMMALLENYVRKAKLRTEVVPALIRNGQVEGQFNLYVDWSETKRNVVWKTMTQPTTGGLPNEAAEPVEDIEEEELTDARPSVEVISDSDVCILPSTVDSIEEALACGGSVTIIRRWTKGKIKQMADDGHLRDDACDELCDAMDTAKKEDHKDQEKENLKAAGIKGRGKHAFVYETWTVLKVGKGKGAERRLCRVYYAGDKRILGIKMNPFWNDRCPLISQPVVKVSGNIRGVPPVSPVSDLQIFANDTINEGADTAHFSAMPIVMTDPERNPRVGTMVLGLAAVWETSPNDTKIVEFPELWASALDRAKAIQQQIFQTLGVNPSMIPQSTGGKAKRNQAEIAQEQQVDLLTTADAATNLEQGALTPMVQRFAEYDHQFRDKETTVLAYGEMGLKATMEMVPPIQLNSRYEYRWCGIEANRNAQQVQQQLSMVNLIKDVPPEKIPGYRINMAPVLARVVDNVLGPRLGSMFLEKVVGITVDPEVENDMMDHGFPAEVHPDDDDMTHLQAHMAAMQQAGDPHGTYRAHITLHMQQAKQKAQAQIMQAGGGPGGQGAPPGQPALQGPPGGGGGGTPPGAQVDAPHAPKQPPGAIPQDSMPRAGATPMPRRM
jgi:hypothetical protein